MVSELGGFAEEPKFVSDAITEEEMQREFECFNYCLAEEYVGSMYKEDFESIGYIDDSLFNNICNWINYNENLGNEKLKQDIKTGALITEKGRTLLEAIAEKRNVVFGMLYTDLGVFDPKVIVMLIEEASTSEEVDSIILNIHDKERLDKLFMSICEKIEKRYKEEGESIEYLKKIKDGINLLHFPRELGFPAVPANLHWTRYLKRTKV